MKLLSNQLTANEVRSLKVGDRVILNRLSNGKLLQFDAMISNRNYQNIFLDFVDFEGDRTMALWFNQLRDDGTFQNFSHEENHYQWSISR